MDINVSYSIGQEVFIIIKHHNKQVITKRVIDAINIEDSTNEVTYSLEKCAHLKKADELYLTQELAIKVLADEK